MYPVTWNDLLLLQALCKLHGIGVQVTSCLSWAVMFCLQNSSPGADVPQPSLNLASKYNLIIFQCILCLTASIHSLTILWVGKPKVDVSVHNSQLDAHSQNITGIPNISYYKYPYYKGMVLSKVIVSQPPSSLIGFTVNTKLKMQKASYFCR